MPCDGWEMGPVRTAGAHSVLVQRLRNHQDDHTARSPRGRARARGWRGGPPPPCVHTLVPPGAILCTQKWELGGWEQPSCGLVWGSGGSLGARRALWAAGLGWGSSEGLGGQ